MRPGLHWPNTSKLDEGARARFAAGRFVAGTILDLTPAEEARWLRQRCGGDARVNAAGSGARVNAAGSGARVNAPGSGARVNAPGSGIVVARLYEPPGALPEPRAFVTRHAGWIGSVLADGQGPLYVQVLNEPDREYPTTSPSAFAAWWTDVVAMLRSEWREVGSESGGARPLSLLASRSSLLRIGFPAPSIGCADSYWAAIAGTGVLGSADFIAERGYWQPAGLMTDPRWGWRWLRSVGFRRPVLLAEYGCSDPATPKPEKARQYLDYARSLPRWVRPVGAFIGAGGDPRWDTAGAGRLWIDDGMCTLIGAGEGERQEVVLTIEQVRGYASLIVATARRHGLAPSLVAGLIDVESGGQKDATSPDNGPGLGHAIGLMQVLQGNFGPGQDGYDPATNLEVGCRILKAKLDAYGDRVESGLAAYFGAVDAAGNPTPATDATGTSGVQYVAEVKGAAARFEDLDRLADGRVNAPGSGIAGGGPADSDFAQYAPTTGTWREACINLKGVADDALAAGRRIVADATATWHGR